VAAVALVALVPLQFAWFYADYLTAYQTRSYLWFERNLAGGLEGTIARADPHGTAPIYVDADIGNIRNFWRFYTIKHARSDLEARTVYFSPATFDLGSIPAGSLVCTSIVDARARALAAAGVLRTLDVAGERDGTPSFVVLGR
jgi:hypothetical protein